jgi:predicted AlkP superfamily phosphohydrolase/phosphomutase
MTTSSGKIDRRSFLKRSAIATAAGAAGIGAGCSWLGSQSRVSRSAGKKVIVIGVDGMDPVLSERLMAAGLLPNLARLRAAGGFSPLGTSVPPQSPVAWANFINGAGPGSHGIFDFIHRHPDEPWRLEDPANPFYGAAESFPGEGYLEVGDHNLPLDFWPFNHRLATTVLRRQGIPFWDYLDEAGVPSTFYDLPCNYPPSPSHYGHHRCLCGMGTPDMLGGYGNTYQYFADNLSPEEHSPGAGKWSRLEFTNETASARLLGPANSLLRRPEPMTVEFLIHRDREANAAVIEIQGQRFVMRAGDWSPWFRLNFALSLPSPLPAQDVTGICRFYLREVRLNFQLYVTPINIDPSAPARPISEPRSFVQDLSAQLGLFYTSGFQEDYAARKEGKLRDDEFVRQATMVLEERLALFEHALNDYDDGLLFFYFSSTDLQSHILWWDGEERHPTRSATQVEWCVSHVHRLYRQLDTLVGDLLDRYGSQATIIVMSDHGFANFGKQFNLNSWLRENHFLVMPPESRSIKDNVDWSQTAAYGLGLNGLYLNLKGREHHGMVEPGAHREAVLQALIEGLTEARDDNGERVIRGVYRSDQLYTGSATALAPDLIIGYRRGYRASWDTVEGKLSDAVLEENISAWSADHCADALEVPGVFFCNRPIRAQAPSLVDVAPSILAEFGLPTPSHMVGKNIFRT